MLRTREEIKSWLDKQEITNYTINDDLSIDVDGNVNLSYKNLTEISVQFNVVKGDFWCDYNQLTSLVGCPKEVNGYFWCDSNQLVSLEGSPKIVPGDFDCDNNQLTSLRGSPKEVLSNFYCCNNKLTSLKYLPEICGYFCCDDYLYKTKEYKIYSISKKLKELV